MACMAMVIVTMVVSAATVIMMIVAMVMATGGMIMIVLLQEMWVYVELRIQIEALEIQNGIQRTTPLEIP